MGERTNGPRRDTLAPTRAVDRKPTEETEETEETELTLLETIRKCEGRNTANAGLRKRISVCKRPFAGTQKRSRSVSARKRLLRAGRPRARSPHGSDFVPRAGYKAARKPPRCSRGLSDRRASSKPRAQPPQAASAGAVNLKVGGNHVTLSLPPPTRGYGGRRSRLPL